VRVVVCDVVGAATCERIPLSVDLDGPVRFNTSRCSIVVVAFCKYCWG